MVRIVLLLLVFGFFGCSQPKERIPDNADLSIQNRKIIIYQVLTRLFGNDHGSNIPYGTIQQNGVGKFNDITDKALQSIRDLGATHVWYTGVIEHSQMQDYSRFDIKVDDADVVKGRAGSPYAIKDYYDVDPDLAVDVPNRMKEFEQLIDRTHRNGLEVIIDFVPNHVARRYASDAKPIGVRDFGAFDDKTVSFKPDNNFYYLPGTAFKVPQGYNPLDSLTFSTEDGKFDETPAKVTGNDLFTNEPGIQDWFGTVKLNYGVDIRDGGKKYFDPIPNTWEKMRDILIYWTTKGIDGFRCDMAQMVPVEFWGWVIPQVKAVNPEILFIAEIYEPSIYRAYMNDGKFDYLYDKVQLYDTLRKLVSGQGASSGIVTVQESLKDINHRMLHFMENHDEQRIASPFFAGDPERAKSAMITSAMIDKGPVMIYFGQELGEQGAGFEGFAGDDGRTTIFDYWCVPSHRRWLLGNYELDSLSPEQVELRGFYRKVLRLARDNQAIVSGSYHDLTGAIRSDANRKLHAFLRKSENEILLVVSSFAGIPAVIELDLQTLVKPDTVETYLVDLIKADTVGSLRNGRAVLQLPAFDSQVVTIEERE